MADLYLTPAERYTAALGGFYYGDLPEPETVYTQLIKDILNGSTPDKEPKNILARFIYSLYISDLGDPYPRYELAKLLYWKLHDITPTKSGSILTVTIDGKEDYMTINTDLSRLWYKVLFGSKTDVITEFPYIFNTMQNKLSDWELFGNTEASGTPTPDSPVIPQGTGERTGNLFDKSTLENGIYLAANGNKYGNITNGVRAGVKIKALPNTAYTLSAQSSANVSLRIFEWSNGTFIKQTPKFNISGNISLTVTTDAETTEIAFNIEGVNTQYATSIMLNTGSTALPYEPYGYKIPISSASTTTPIYLGEVETTRKIRKIEVEIERVITLGNRNKGGVTKPFSGGSAKSGLGLCDKALYGGSSMIGGVYINRDNAVFVGSQTDTLDDLKSKYNGASLWYVLAEPETAVVNEPLMKIGDYADSMSRTQTGIDIPTVIGQNTLDVLTTVKPSSMSIEYISADETKSRSKRISLLKSPLKKGLIK